MTVLPARRLLLVHAHPDDESINNGATMARYAAEGALVTLVTCTLGEEGEVIPPGLAHLAPDREDRLGEHRVGELAAAMKELGVTDHRFLGGPGRFRDSGMMGAPQNRRENAFWNTDVDVAAPYLVEVIRETRPQVLVTYDPDGGYGHPDHIQAHRVAMRAAELAADPAYRPDLGPAHAIAKIYWNRVPRPVAEAAFARLSAEGSVFPADATIDDVPGVVDEARITAEVSGGTGVGAVAGVGTGAGTRSLPGYAARKSAAMAAHATQVAVDGPFFALSNNLAQPLFTTEYYELVHGTPGAPADERETDLFAGLPAEPEGPSGQGGGATTAAAADLPTDTDAS
ncbi:N-acetyl-1-D-myo-inositol-2-amino-2-deoxy-alpha-D-glucopyranoside deacetylase [Streptomyces roseicoloratus]|uniref:N-acetyl-1-D-myo-inositol-2-amino-2-deoxy-alpha- D-glucopyranoside deacetylase n=1 Tax=Streptomyces roseicoloratus TaxID=2508722 RepID=UPI001009FA9B|nr:N-acetyl-1-D-myo-inositol-2-amino-2-deoxy-alpha-D-glucopyranoside deacetylase [Streptomyces roseicoloratus]